MVSFPNTAKRGRVTSQNCKQPSRVFHSIARAARSKKIPRQVNGARYRGRDMTSVRCNVSKIATGKIQEACKKSPRDFIHLNECEFAAARLCIVLLGQCTKGQVTT